MDRWKGSNSSPFLPPAKFLTGDVNTLPHQPIYVLRTHGPGGAIHHLVRGSFGFCLLRLKPIIIKRSSHSHLLPCASTSGLCITHGIWKRGPSPVPFWSCHPVKGGQMRLMMKDQPCLRPSSKVCSCHSPPAFSNCLSFFLWKW